MTSNSFTSEMINSILPSSKFDYQNSIPIVNHLVNTSREFFFVQSRYLVIIACSYFILQKIVPIVIFDVVLAKTLQKRNIQSISVGFFILNFFSKIKILLKNGSKILISKLKIQKKLIDDSGRKSLLIDLIDVNLVFPSLNKKDNKQSEPSEELNDDKLVDKLVDTLRSLSLFDLKPYFNNRFTALFVFKLFFPLQFSLQKVKLNLGSMEFYADYISIRLSYNKKRQTVVFSFFVHELNNYKNINLKNFEYEIEAEWSHDSLDHTLSFSNYSSSFKFANLSITINPKLKVSEDKVNKDQSTSQNKIVDICKNKDEALKKYGKAFTDVCTFLKVVEIKVEDIDIKIPDRHLKFYCAAMTLRFNGLDSHAKTSGYECTFSSNTIALKIYNENVVTLPLLNIYLVGDSLYDFEDIENFKCNVKCLVSCIESNIVISEKIIQYIIYNFMRSNKEENNEVEADKIVKQNTLEEDKVYDEKMSLLLYLFDFFCLDFKFMIPNAKITYMMDDSEIAFNNNQAVFHLKSPKNIYHLYDELLGGSHYDYDEDLRLTSTISSVKSSDISVQYRKYTNAKKLSDKFISVLSIKKLELQNYQNNIFQVDNLISGTAIEIIDIEMIQEILDACQKVKAYYAQKCKLFSSSTKSTSSLKRDIIKRINFKLRLLDFGLTNAFSRVISSKLDPTNILFDKFYGFKGFIKNLEFLFTDNTPSIRSKSIIMSLIEQSPDLLTENKKCASFDDFEMNLLNDEISLLFDKCSLKIDLATIWTGFYLALAYKNLNFNSKHKNVQKKKSNRNYKLNINTITMDTVLVDNLNMLLNMKAFELSPKKLSIALFQTFNESTYDSKSLEIVKDADDEPIFTRLMHVNDICIHKGNELDDYLAVIDANTFELRSEYHLKFYKIFDRIVSTFKSLKQLKTGLSSIDEFIQNQPSAVKPISIPSFKVKLERFLVKVDEDPFEQKLNIIYKVGYLEQRLRLDKQAIFEAELGVRQENNPLTPTQIHNAKYRLKKNFSTSWIERIKKAKKEFLNESAYKIVEKEFLDRTVKIYSGHEKIPLLVYSLINMEFIVKPPSFGVSNYAEFIHKYGKSVPKDTVYTLLILLNAYLKCDLLKLQLRDYALPILFFPNMVLSGDLALGEPMPDKFGVREVWVPFIKNPRLCDNDSHIESTVFGSNIKRTINSVKFYMNLNVDIDSQQPTILTWGKSLQPAIQAVMMWFDFLTKPPLDPSPKIGFWDKIRLLAHGVIKFNWAENSELHLNMKGSTDPYEIHEFGAGLTFCWKGNTSLTVHENSNPADFLKIRSKSFILGVRNFDALYEKDKFSKIMMRLDGNVVWRMGLLFEMGDIQHPGQTRRSTKFDPHYKVYLANPALLKGKQDIEKHDSYKYFRSDFIHMDIGVYSNDKDISKNTVHLAPFCSEHFLAWWKLFNTFTSGPIRQGSLFPSMQQSSTKFGRSLFTLKYQMKFTNLDMAHVYRHSSSEDDNSDDIMFTGLKGKFDEFTLDLHQKRSPVTFSNEMLNRVRKIWKLKMDQGEIDFLNADIRLIHSVFKSNDSDGSNEDKNLKSDAYKWYAACDYTDLDDFKGLPSLPDLIETIPLLKSERISYFRNIERKVYKVDYPFGNESFHKCLSGKHDSEQTQINIYYERLDVLKKRIAELSEGFKYNSKNFKAEHLHKKDYQNQESLEYFVSQKNAIENLIEKFQPIMQMLRRTDSGVSLGSEDLELINPIPTLISKKETDFKSDKNSNKSTFDNKFVIHNMKLEVNELSKKLLLNYVKKMEERKATSFYDSYKALNILKDMVEYRDEFDESIRTNAYESTRKESYNRDLDYHVKLDSMENSECIKSFDDIIRSVADINFFSSDNMVLKFIMPQIQLSSSSAPDWGTMILANEIEVGIIDILQGRDSALTVKSVDNLKETRICMLLSEVKMFTLDKQSALKHPSLKFEMANSDNNHSWIPFLPVESFINAENLGKFTNFIKSSMYLSFTNPNDLFYDKISHSVNKDDPILRIGIPEIHMQVTKYQYTALYAICDDLLTFGSKENRKWETLAKTFLANELKRNFSVSASFIMNLQKKIRAIRLERTIMKDNDPDAFEEIRDEVEKELDSDRFELRLLITSLKKNFYGSKKRGGKTELSKILWYFSADDLICDFYDDPDTPFITLGLGFSSFQRTAFSDGSNSNMLMLSTLHCFNLGKKAKYEEIISPLKEYNTSNAPLLELKWKMDRPVGGISQINSIDVCLRPLRLQLEHQILEKIVNFLLSNHNSTEDKNHAKHNEDARIQELEEDLENDQNEIISAGEGLSEMVNRSSKYMAIKKIVVNKTVVAVSYRGAKKITNLNDLIVKIPVLKYENKVWSSDDFISALKKDLVKIVLSHTGNIIGNKFKSKKKMESKYESFKQFSKLLRNDSMVGRRSLDNGHDDESTFSQRASMPDIAEDEEETEEIKKFSQL
ncbi:uncharacterized protein HGUI_03590 [Hanseniaspora guilliermondii]|uniref:Protein FMP27, mitochondrial n=1 Tax=Hanseniaspora guilliermondii TaxID=56406 RepID=A0A1L0CQV6_9ASCO|nr:uncharacterized protein HGUI_03590 [Hanseniaspora guilliermondii]